MLKKILLSLTVIFGFAGYAYNQSLNDQAPAVATASSSTNVSSNPPLSSAVKTAAKSPQPLITEEEGDDDGQLSAVPISTPKPVVVPSPVPTNRPTGRYKDGTYLGPVTDAYFGNVQVKAIVSGGQLTDVQFLDYPHDRNTSARINAAATPILRSEAIKAQSAQVDGVSGATQTSQAFIESLSAALAQA
jgi:uncharacterized protein with FMN-binding domain